jgi:hypothetical protein
MLMDSVPPSKDTSWQTGIKREKEDPDNLLFTKKSHLTDRNKHCLRVKGWKKIYQANGPQKQAGVAILISDKVDFKPKLVRRDKGHFILIKEAIQQEEITIINLYAPMLVHPTLLNIH